MDTKDSKSHISSVSNDALDQLDRRNHALDGAVFLNSASNFGDGAGVAPTRRYSGFIVLSVPTITSITFTDTNKYLFATGEDITTVDEYFFRRAVLSFGFYYIDYYCRSFNANSKTLIGYDSTGDGV